MNMMHANSEMIEKQKKVQDLVVACVRSCESIREVARRQHSDHRRYMKVYNQHVAKKRYQKKKTLKCLKIKFFESNCFEFDEQFSNFNHEFSSKTYVFSKRERLVILFFDKIITKQDLEVQRLIITEVIHAFCNRIKSMSKSMSQKFSKHRFSENSRMIKYSLRCQSKICLFCLIKSENRVFSTRSRLIRHFEKFHYSSVKDKTFECLHSNCHERLRHIHHFQVYVIQVHGIEFTKKCDMAFQQFLHEVCEALTIL